jgi:putative transcriptional regulator
MSSKAMDKKAMSDAGRSILRGLEDALAFSKGDKSRARVTFVFVPRAVNVKGIRGKMRLSQAEFAKRFGFTVSSIRDWEQGRRKPRGPARILLTIIDKEPKAVLRALAG